MARSWKPNLVFYTDMWNTRFNSQGGNGNVSDNVFPGVVEILLYLGDMSILVRLGLSPVAAGSVGLRLVDTMRELSENCLWICSSDGSLQGSSVANKWGKTVTTNMLWKQRETQRYCGRELIGGERRKEHCNFPATGEEFWGLSTHKAWKLLWLHKHSTPETGQQLP